MVRATWLALQAAGCVETPFLTYEWFSGFADCPSLAKDVRVLVVLSDGRPAGLWPAEWTRGPGGLRRISVPGGRWLAPDHLDVVALPGCRSEVSVAVLQHLAGSRDWDVLELDGLSSSGSLARSIAAWVPRLRSIPLAPKRTVVPYVSLVGQNDQQLIPSRNLRQQVRRGLRIAEGNGGTFAVVEGPRRVSEFLTRMMQLHNARFGASSAVFATPARRDFHQLVAGRMAGAGMARTYVLTTGAEPVAILYALVLGGTAYYYSMGIVPDAALSPGRTVLGQAILSAARGGLQEFDLLRGDHPFKERFANGHREDVSIRAARPSLPVMFEGSRRVAATARRWLRPAPA